MSANKRPHEIRRCFVKELSGRWSWMAIVFLSEGMFADLTLKSTRSVKTKREARRDMEHVISTVWLSEHRSSKT